MCCIFGNICDNCVWLFVQKISKLKLANFDGYNILMLHLFLTSDVSLPDEYASTMQFTIDWCS